MALAKKKGEAHKGGLGSVMSTRPSPDTLREMAADAYPYL